MLNYVKKFGCMILCFVILVSCFNFSANAVYEPYMRTVASALEAEELAAENDVYIKNNGDRLFDSAKAENRVASSCIMKCDDDALSTPVYVIQDEELSNGHHAATYAVEVSEAAVNSGSKSENKTDGSYFVRLYMTIYYDIADDRGANVYCLTKVSGSYEILSRQCSVTSQKVTYGMSGLGVAEQSNTVYPSSSSWSYTTGFSGYIIIAGGYGWLGGSYTAYLKRGTATSSLTLDLLFN